MKIILFIKLFLILELLSCGLPDTDDKVKFFIPGTYVRYYKDEYTSSFDTITIKGVTTSGSDGYTITKRSRFKKRTNDGRIEPGHELKNWTGVYDQKTKTLLLETTGKRIYFDPHKNELKIGTQPYKKLEP